MSTKFDLDAAFIRKLAKLLEETGLSEIEYAEGDKKIRCAVTRGTVVHHSSPGAPPIPAVASPAGAEAPPQGKPVLSPMVGTVYLAPAPDAAPFVKVGDKVKPGDTLLIIEAMKVMNPIKATQGGTVSEILASSGKPVEFGETLILLA
ncbi:MAG: acetyl-CoA carboxylase biotin carboxyl carrier protein [Pseudomonadota bacterium]|nr:acetyl-CoA carboxylase biotin carboxyl carrier protein [Pseudomonadota bacterium]